MPYASKCLSSSDLYGGLNNEAVEGLAGRWRGGVGRLARAATSGVVTSAARLPLVLTPDGKPILNGERNWGDLPALSEANKRPQQPLDHRSKRRLNGSIASSKPDFIHRKYLHRYWRYGSTGCSEMC
ncbi:hypothetical protein GE061_020067 [Apolygus lucorum]|uniref:Uncharacterized protein n=1 Tax=Apolygus lucorum TaxID=248454 RepID=A0A8S9XA45_APOLU|nr:hypothetical protein GE061_020067 [Apolygus lucorum]